jgi:hypothetical protein
MRYAIAFGPERGLPITGQLSQVAAESERLEITAMLPARTAAPTPNRVPGCALRLKPEQRLPRADLLYASLDEPDPDVEAAWEKEVARRIGEVEDGKVKLIPWSVARRRIFAPRRNKK